MTNTEFISKVIKSNTSVSYNELLNVVSKFPIMQGRDLENLDTVLTDENIRKFTDAVELIFYIEKESRSLEVKQAKTRRATRERELQELADIYAQKFTDELKLNNASLKAFGFKENSNNLCISCGFIPTSDGRCKC
jgi:hypothetical protein